MSRILAVIPCFNEAARLKRAAFLEFVASVDEIGLIFVDDGSRDATGDVLQQMRAAAPGSIDVVTLKHNSGKAEAVRCGMLRAFELGAGHAGFWDADLATPLCDIPRFASLLDDDPQAQIVMGARVQLLGRHIDRSAVRHYLGRVFATAVSVGLGIPVYDTQCGAKLFRVTETTRRIFADRFRSRWIFDVELLARFIVEWGPDRRDAIGIAVREFPLMQWRDIHGSKVRLRDFARATLELATILREYRRNLRLRTPDRPAGDASARNPKR